MPSYYSSVQDRFFNVKDIKTVFCHFLSGVDGHVIESQQNLLADSFNQSVRHARSLPESHSS